MPDEKEKNFHISIRGIIARFIFLNYYNGSDWRFFCTNLQRQLLQRKTGLTLRRDTFFSLHLGHSPLPSPNQCHRMHAHCLL